MVSKSDQIAGADERGAGGGRRSYVKQADIPKLTLEESLRLPQSLMDDFAGYPTAPHQLALALEISPTSSGWEDLCGAAIAYGLTEGGSRASVISLTDLGRRIVAPTEEGQDVAAQAEAALRPTIARRFCDRYNRSKFPQDKIAKNVLAEMGVPRDRVDRALEILKRNFEVARIIHQTKTGPFLALDADVPAPRLDRAEPEMSVEREPKSSPVSATPAFATPTPASPTTAPAQSSDKVFITHGRNREIVNQLKELLIFGKFEPVVAVEHETPSKPVPDKVLDDMRTCSAAIIHVASEQQLLDGAGTVHHKINENVLIEIGAAMALYRRKFILLVEKGIKLPSNLQGLYVCYYEGDRLDYEATMKLLRAFSEFRAQPN